MRCLPCRMDDPRKTENGRPHRVIRFKRWFGVGLIAPTFGKRLLMPFVVPHAIFALLAFPDNEAWLIAILNGISLALATAACAPPLRRPSRRSSRSQRGSSAATIFRSGSG